MENKPFKKAKSGLERVIVMPAAPLGHMIFAIIFAVTFVNLRIFALRSGLDGFFVYAGLGVVSLILTGIVLNCLPERFVRDEGAGE